MMRRCRLIKYEFPDEQVEVVAGSQLRWMPQDDQVGFVIHGFLQASFAHKSTLSQELQQRHLNSLEPA